MSNPIRARRLRPTFWNEVRMPDSKTPKTVLGIMNEFIVKYSETWFGFGLVAYIYATVIIILVTL